MIFVAGLAVSLFGLVTSIAAFREDLSPIALLLLYTAFSLLFGWAVILWLTAPLRVKPRIVPYFSGALGAYGGPTMAAFRRGRALYREIAALDERAATLKVTPLSAFGFADDYYEQAVRWHAASEGLKTAEALRGTAESNGEMAGDLDALVSVLRTAVERGVSFSLVLRLQARDNMQVVCTGEPRQGSFW